MPLWVKKNRIVHILSLIIILFFFMRLSSFPSFMPEGSTAKQIFARFSQLFTVYITIKYFSRRRISPIVLFWILYMLLGLVTTVFSNGSVHSVIQLTYPILSICMLNELEMPTNSRNYFLAYSILLTFFVTINALLLPFSQELYGEYRYFFGNRNGVMIPCLFSVVISYIACSYSGKNKKLFYYNLLIGTLNIVWGGSSGGLLSWSAFILLYFLPVLKTMLSKVGLLGATTLIICAEIGIVVFRFQNFFAFIIEDIMHKSLTLTHRTLIWDKVLPEILRHPMIGYGVQKDTNLFTIHYMENNALRTSTFSTHNELLRILYEQGFLSLIILIAILLICWVTSHPFRRNPDIYLLYIALIALLIQMITEAPGIYSVMVILSLIWCYSNILRGGEYDS